MECVLTAPLAVLFYFQPRLNLFLVTVSVVSYTVALATLQFDEIILRHKKFKI